MWAEIVNGIDLLALVATLGALLQAGWLLALDPVAGSAAAASQVRRRVDGYFFITLALLTSTTVAALPARSADISGLPLDRLGPVVLQVLGQTHFGSIWWLRIAVLVAFWLAWLLLRASRRRAWVWVGIVCLLIEAWSWSVTAHPGDHGSFTVAVWVAVVHIFSAGLWGGTVLAVAVAMAPAAQRLEALGTDAVLSFVRRLSAASALGLALVVASGIYNAWTQLGRFANFWMSAYGQVLALKLVLVLVLAALGAGNRYWRVPRLVRAYRTPASPISQAGSLAHSQWALRRLLGAVAWEAVVLLAILAMVSVLVHTMPPADMANMSR